MIMDKNINLDLTEYDYDFWNVVNEIKQLNREFFEKNGRKRTAYIETFGCQMNEHDSEKIDWLLRQMDFYMSDRNSDLYIINTCSIRKNAEDKVYGRLGELKGKKRENENLLVAVCGCMMQRKESRDIVLEKFPNVDMIFGTNNIYKFPKLLLERLENGVRAVDIEENYSNEDNLLGANRMYSFKSFVNIMYGCNNFCTYCIVPYTRGREKSRRPMDIVNEIKGLASHGVKEVTLLGQNVNSYGKSLSNNVSFVDLLKMVNEIDGIERIRFMTSHPRDFSKELAYAYRDLDKLKNFLHLPVQAGSSKVLRDMNRHYTKEEYIRKIDMVKEIVPEIALSTDLMVGFPTETEEDFKDTLDLCKYVEYDTSFTFIYSMREGTKSYEMDQVPEEIKHDRFNRLLDLIYPIQLKKNENEIGKVRKVLVESTSKSDENKLSGRTDEFKLVNFDGSKDLIGKIVDVDITDVNTFSLKGDLVEKR